MYVISKTDEDVCLRGPSEQQKKRFVAQTEKDAYLFAVDTCETYLCDWRDSCVGNVFHNPDMTTRLYQDAQIAVLGTWLENLVNKKNKDEINHILAMYLDLNENISPSDFQDNLKLRGHKLTYRECCYLFGDSEEVVNEHMLSIGRSKSDNEVHDVENLTVDQIEEMSQKAMAQVNAMAQVAGVKDLYDRYVDTVLEVER